MFRSATDLQVSNVEEGGRSNAKSLCDGRLASLKAEEAGQLTVFYLVSQIRF
jgi:hypothetical protein